MENLLLIGRNGAVSLFLSTWSSRSSDFGSFVHEKRPRRVQQQILTTIREQDRVSLGRRVSKYPNRFGERYSDDIF